MRRPEFDHEEEYIIAYYRQYRKAEGRRSLAIDLTCLAMGAVFVGLGYFKEDFLWSIIGFAVMGYQLMKGAFSGLRYNNVIASVIVKYEEALKQEKKAGCNGDVSPDA